MKDQENKLKIVLLPGMDGTGELFAPLLKYFQGYTCQVIALPQSGPQDYSSLTKYVKKQLPKQEFVLIAESFSGPIAAKLAQQKIGNLKGVVFVATFLSSPNKALLSLAKQLPIKILSKLPGARYFIKKFFMGSSAEKHLIDQFISLVDQTPVKILKNRIDVMQKLRYQKFISLIPSIYILAKSDKLVPDNKAKEFRECFNGLLIKEIDGPHFVLQTEAIELANVIEGFLSKLESFDQN